MDNEVLVYVIPKPAAVPAGDVTSSEWITEKGKIAALKERGLSDLPDVDATGRADGDTVVWDETEGHYVHTTQQTGIRVETGTDATTVNTESTRLFFRHGITAADSGTFPGERSVIDLSFAGSGSATTASRSDHSHSAPVGKREPFAATGVLSSGTRGLVDTTIGPLTLGITYDVEAWFLVRARNNVNSGTFNLLCRVGVDAAYPQVSRNVQTVGGVPVDQHVDFGDENGDMVIVGTGASIPVKFDAQFSTGDAVDLRDGFYRVIARPRR